MFTLAIPTLDDFDSLSCCLMANLHQPHVAGAVVVDNAPHSRQGALTRKLCDSAGVRYVAYPDAVGTGAAKDMAVRSCTPGYVIGLDSHVVLLPGATDALKRFYAGDPDRRKDLIHGPMVADNRQGLSTHLTPTWDAGRAASERERLKAKGWGADLIANVVEGRQLWSEGMWGQWDRDPRGKGTTPFEIPLMGMGLFATHTDTWLGFHPDQRGFGGEEGYIHRKYQRSGRRVWCVPGLKWWHRFGRGQEAAYRVSNADKFRNYRIGFQEIGEPTDELDAHFLALLGRGEFDRVVSGAYNPLVPVSPKVAEAKKAGCQSCGRADLEDLPTLHEAVVKAGSKPSDINEHVATLYGYAQEADAVLDVGSRAESALALAGTKGRYHHLGTLKTADRVMVHKYRGEEVTAPAATALPEYDLVFIDTDPHEADAVYAQLTAMGTRSRHRIVLHDTVTYGEQGSRGGPGILPAVRRFVRERPEWTVVRHDRNNNGLMTLSRKDADKKKLPSLWQGGVNALKAIARSKDNVLGKDGPLKDTPAQDARLALCMVCPSLNDGKCAECRCPVEKKTGWPAEMCPLGHWDAITPEGQA